MRLRLTEILDYYDVPQLVVALDAVGTQYLCLAYDEDEAGRLKCIAANTSATPISTALLVYLALWIRWKRSKRMGIPLSPSR